MADLVEVHKYNIPQLCSLCKTESMQGKILKAIPLVVFVSLNIQGTDYTIPVP